MGWAGHVNGLQLRYRIWHCTDGQGVGRRPEVAVEARHYSPQGWGLEGRPQDSCLQCNTWRWAPIVEGWRLHHSQVVLRCACSSRAGSYRTLHWNRRGRALERTGDRSLLRCCCIRAVDLGGCRDCMILECLLVHCFLQFIFPLVKTEVRLSQLSGIFKRSLAPVF